MFVAVIQIIYQAYSSKLDSAITDQILVFNCGIFLFDGHVLDGDSCQWLPGPLCRCVIEEHFQALVDAFNFSKFLFVPLNFFFILLEGAELELQTDDVCLEQLYVKASGLRLASRNLGQVKQISFKIRKPETNKQCKLILLSWWRCSWQQITIKIIIIELLEI